MNESWVSCRLWESLLTAAGAVLYHALACSLILLESTNFCNLPAFPSEKRWAVKLFSERLQDAEDHRPRMVSLKATGSLMGRNICVKKWLYTSCTGLFSNTIKRPPFSSWWCCLWALLDTSWWSSVVEFALRKILVLPPDVQTWAFGPSKGSCCTHPSFPGPSDEIWYFSSCLAKWWLGKDIHLSRVQDFPLVPEKRWGIFPTLFILAHFYLKIIVCVCVCVCYG
jgi:hypothetical protein